MDDLTSEFVAETRETLERIGDALIAWEANPRETARLDEIFRFVHTVKGSCGFLDLARIEALAHAAETVLGALRSGEREADGRMVGAMLRLIDRIALLVEALESGESVPDAGSDGYLIEGLNSESDHVEDAEAEPDILTAAKPVRAVRINVDLLDAMMSQVSDLVLARNELARAIRTVRGDTDAEATLDRLSMRVGDLRDSVARARMQPVERLFAALPRLVRDTAEELGKSVRLVIEGSNVELDREMVEQLRDPLIHIVRNAIDHGIENPEERQKSGKPDQAILRITARQSGNQVAIEIADDGRGIDIERLLARAIGAGVVDARAAAQLSDEAVAQLIFAAGLSTASEVTAISGRGVGMDVARANIERLGGSIALDNRPGHGLTVDLRAPLTLSIITVLIVESGGHRFAVPRTVIEEVLSCASASVRVELSGAGRIATIRNETLPMLPLSRVLEGAEEHEAHLLVIQPTGGRRYVLAVARVCDHEEVVVRPVAPVLAGSNVFAGQTLPDNGLPLLLLDALGMARHAKLDLDRAIEAVECEVEQVAQGGSVLIFTGLDGVRRGVHTALVDRIEDVPLEAFTVAGNDAFVTVDGLLRPAILDAALPETGPVTMLRLSDGERTMGYPVTTVHDLGKIDASSVASAGNQSVALADGVALRVIDGYRMFTQLPATHPVERPLAVIANADDRWARAMLVPLVEAAGYRVAFGAPDASAAIVFISAGEDGPADSKAQIVRLHEASEDAPADSIDRYDRLAIESVLRDGLKRAGRQS